MKICVIGAGAIGGLLAAKLAEAGEEVGVVARGAQLKAIREHGLVLREEDKDIVASVAASDPARTKSSPHARWSSGMASMWPNLASTVAADLAPHPASPG